MRVCDVTGKTWMSGNNVSHANNKTKRRFKPNLHWHTFSVNIGENVHKVRLLLSKKGLKMVDKFGIEAVLEMIQERNKNNNTKKKK